MRSGKHTLNLIFGIFAVIGTIFLVTGICWLVSGIKFRETAVKVNGEISQIFVSQDSDGDVSHDVFVNYTYEGKKYENVQINFWNSSMYEGKSIELLVDPENPGKISAKSVWAAGAAVFAGMGLIFALTGIIPIVISICSGSKKKKLLAGGKYILGTVESIDINTSYTVNGCHPYVVYCTYRDEFQDVTYRFKSGNIRMNPEPVIQAGSELRIYVDGEDFSKYYVDVENALKGKIVDYT